MEQWPVHAQFDGPILMIGFGSIGRGLLPLLERHIKFSREKFLIMSPDDSSRYIADERGFRFEKRGLTKENIGQVLSELLDPKVQGMVINVSVCVSSFEIMQHVRAIGWLYIDSATEEWPESEESSQAVSYTLDQCTNYVLREEFLEYRRNKPDGVTAIITCGANPGSVSWFVKQALLNMVADGVLAEESPEVAENFKKPETRAEWAKLMQNLGVVGVQVAETDTQRTNHPKDPETFVNTWSVDGFLEEILMPSEFGWGTHERHWPSHGRHFEFGCGSAIYLARRSGETRVRSWTPSAKAQHGFLITHSETLSIADYFTIKDGSGKVVYRPTVQYAYHPSNDSILSLDQLAGSQWQPQPHHHILTEDEIVDGHDELGVMVFGARRGAYWYGSKLTIQEARKLAPYQNATGLQVTAALIAGIVWMIENPRCGLVEPDEMDFSRCLNIEKPYLGKLYGVYTDWTPLTDRTDEFPEDKDAERPWQFKNMLVGTSQIWSNITTDK